MVLLAINKGTKEWRVTPIETSCEIFQMAYVKRATISLLHHSAYWLAIQQWTTHFKDNFKVLMLITHMLSNFICFKQMYTFISNTMGLQRGLEILCNLLHVCVYNYKYDCYPFRLRFKKLCLTSLNSAWFKLGPTHPISPGRRLLGRAWARWTLIYRPIQKRH